MKKINVIGNDSLSTDRTAFKVIPFALIGILSFFAYYLLNINTPPFGDDILVLFKNFSMGAGTDDRPAERITQFSEIISNLVSYYVGYRGRLTAEGLEMMFAVYGKKYFNYINAFIFTGMTYLVYYHANYEKKANWKLFLCVCAVFWFLSPNMTMSYLWMVCSFYTVWPIFFILLFLVPYRKLLLGIEVKHPRLTALFVVSVGFFAGSLSELSLALSIGFVVLSLIVQLFRKKKIPVWAIMGLVSTICGTIILFLSPGYKDNCLEKYGQTPLQLYFNELPNRIPGAVQLSFNVTKVLLPFAIIISIWLIFDISLSSKSAIKNKKKGKQIESMFSFKSFVDDKNGMLIPGLFFIVTIGSIVVATALPYYEYRLFFTVFACFVLVLFSLLSEALGRLEISESKLKKIFSNKYVLIAVPAIISLITIFDFGKEYRIYHQHFEVYNSVTDSIEAEVAAGEKDIIVRNKTEIPQRLLPEGRLRSIIDNWSVTGLTEDVNGPLNRYYAYYFGADSIRGERSANDPPVSKKDGIIASNY